MTDDTVRDTTIQEPSMTAGEVEMLLFALERARAQFVWKCGGLDAAGLRKLHPPSAMTLGGLLKHLALLEDWLIVKDLGEGPMPPPWNAANFEADPEWDWHTAGDDTPETLYGLWQSAVERSRTAWARAIADGGLDRPSKVVLDSGESPNLRRVLVDLIEEYLRHTGHADLLREAVDGLVGNDPPHLEP